MPTFSPHSCLVVNASEYWKIIETPVPRSASQFCIFYVRNNFFTYLPDAPCSSSCLVPSTLPICPHSHFILYVEQVTFYEIIYSKFTLFLFPSVLYHYSRAVTYIMNNVGISLIILRFYFKYFPLISQIFWYVLITAPHP